MTIVIGTAGHIDHGKTTLLRALTGIDADRLPEERRRGMTIDVGYAHLGLPDGSELDFVDVPGHDRLVGNMLVGAGEIDAFMLVVAADDGPRAQTVEHVELLDALGLRHGIAVISKADIAGEIRIGEVRAEVERLLADTTLGGSPVLAASSVDGRGIEDVRQALLELRDRATAATTATSWTGSRRSRLAVDRVFSVKGRGLVVTGTLRGGPLARNATLRLVPGGDLGRARELQVHGRSMDTAGPGRTAINLAGIEPVRVHRGVVLTDDPAIVATDRILVRLRRAVPDATPVRVHLGTAAVDGAVGRSGRDAVGLDDASVAAILRLATPVAAGPGDRFVLRRATSPDRAIGGVVLDVTPPRGISRRRQTSARVSRLAAAIEARDSAALDAARLDFHGAVVDGGTIAFAPDVAEAATVDVVDAIGERAAAGDARPSLAVARARIARTLRRLVTMRRDDAAIAADVLVDRLVGGGLLVRDGDQILLPGTARKDSVDADPAMALAMDRLADALAVASPPSLAEAARVAGCPEVGVRELVRTGRIVVLERDLAYETGTYRAVEALALELASRAPLTPAMLRDATGTSRKYVMAILADLDRREILRRTESGHIPGPRAASASAARVAPVDGTPVGER